MENMYGMLGISPEVEAFGNEILKVSDLIAKVR